MTRRPGHGRAHGARSVTRKIKWERRYNIIPHSALLSTAGGLVFIATYEGKLQALDAETGGVLWEFNLGSGSTARSSPTPPTASSTSPWSAATEATSAARSRKATSRTNSRATRRGALVAAFALD